jgi:adenylyl- and sulfurtransferase ThiI
VEAGLQTVGWLSGGIDSELAAAAAAKRDVELTLLSRYTVTPTAEGPAKDYSWDWPRTERTVVDLRTMTLAV